MRGAPYISVKLLLIVALTLHLNVSGRWREGKAERGKGVKMLLTKETTH